MTPAPAGTYAHASPVVEYVTGDMLAIVQRQVAPTEFIEVVETYRVRVTRVCHGIRLLSSASSLHPVSIAIDSGPFSFL